MQKFVLKKILLILAILLAVFFSISFYLQAKLISLYNGQESQIILDRTGKIIATLPNSKGYYAYYVDSLPKELTDLLIKKEDRFFYYHPGFNPISMIQAGLTRFGMNNRKASSAITQQLTKILLGNELDRNIKNKIIETIYAVALEIFHTKEEILTMYTNSLYLGNSSQGIYQASQMYFKVPPELLSHAQFLQLLATISSPSSSNPLKQVNEEVARNLGKRLEINSDKLTFVNQDEVKTNISEFRPIKTSYFEISSFLKNQNIQTNKTTIDIELTKKIREIVKRNIDELKVYGANNASAIIISIPDNEILALIGSPDPDSLEETYKIDILNQARPIGSTIKPFIYLKAFEKNLRPYTLVDDREYKYMTAIGFPLYPKNYDFDYRGIVTLHYALSNSLNVPSVKVLEWLGLEQFYDFLTDDLAFNPVQDLGEYQLGIALGSLEMKAIDLAKYFTIFANKGILKNLKITDSPNEEKSIADEKYIQLVNKIISDRKTGIEQFSIKSELNLSQSNYALKTGTSRDFRDSWIIGFTPDFLVLVWVGNADNSPTEKVSGQIGAGRIWHEIMELLFNTQYNKKTALDFNLLHKFENQDNIEYGFIQDNYEEYKNLLLDEDESIILLPHQNDTFFLEETIQIILRAKESVEWSVNNIYSDTGTETIFTPKKSGNYIIKAETKTGRTETVSVQILD
ncbi:transglycosylase domain-containing protein [Patescibacteria group bacterium]|nr:transglycosylase domain-containing protein [Patescibacteria group bacterium]